MLRQPEHPRLLVARLRPWRHRADLDETEAQRKQRIDVLAILVQPRGQADGVGEGQAKGPGGKRPWRGPKQALQPQAVQRLERGQADAMRALRVKGEDEGARQAVHAGLRGRT